MKLSLGEKTFRVVRFLLGVRNPRVAQALAGYGFKQTDRDEGWSLIHALGKGRLAVLPPGPRDMEALLKLDAWENQWFPISQAALERRFPAVAARFFLNLSQTEGPEVAISVRTFVDRFDELAAMPDKYGAEAPKAVELLRARGVTAAVIEEARKLLTTLTQVDQPAEAVALEQEEEELTQAEDAMWAWYLEWSKIARVAIKNRPLLKQLGFLAARRGDGGGGDGGIDDGKPGGGCRDGNGHGHGNYDERRWRDWAECGGCLRRTRDESFAPVAWGSARDSRSFQKSGGRRSGRYRAK